MSPRATVPSSIVLNKGGPEIFSGKYNACTQRQIGMYYSTGCPRPKRLFQFDSDRNKYASWI